MDQPSQVEREHTCQVIREVADLMEEAANYVPRHSERAYFTELAVKLHRAAGVMAVWEVGSPIFQPSSIYVQTP
jgi:hypothetical protein